MKRSILKLTGLIILSLSLPVSSLAGTWSLVESGVPGNLHAVWGAPSGELWAGGAGGVLLRWDGQAWTNTAPPEPALTWEGLWGSGPADVIAAGYTNRLWAVDAATARWDGAAWTRSTPGAASYLREVWGSSPEDVFAVGSGGAILHWDGVSWSRMPSGTAVNLFGVWGSAWNDVWAVGLYGMVLHWDGASWSRVTSGTSENLYGVWGTPTGDVFAVGNRGSIRRWDGAAWNAMSGGGGAILNAVWGTSAEDVWAVGASGVILHYDGAAWTTVPSGTTAHLLGVWGRSAGEVWAVGSGGTVLRYRDKPEVTGVNPGRGPRGERLTVEVSGSGLVGALSVGFGDGVVVEGFGVRDGTSLLAALAIEASSAPGPRDVSVVSAGGTGTLPGGFTVTAPPAVRTEPAEQVTYDGAVLRGALEDMGSAGAVEVRFLWGPAPERLDSQTPPQVMSAPGPFAFALSGLEPGATCFYRASASGDGEALGEVMSFSTEVSALVEIRPRTLNPANKGAGAVVTAFITLPPGMDPGLILLSSVRLEAGSASIPPKASPAIIGDANGDGVPEMMVKFSRAALLAALAGRAGRVEVTVRGDLAGGGAFSGTDTVRLLDKTKARKK